MKNILVSGSLAYDYIMSFPDSFKHHILPDQIHILNVAFTVEKLQKNLGGCAGNIAYTIKLLGAEPLIVAPIGSDAQEYFLHWEKQGIRTEYIEKIDSVLTASAYITTDKDDNQITAFYPGALMRDENVKIETVRENTALAIISPTNKHTMIAHAKECAEKNIPFCFDPGQQITALSAQELMLLIGQATYVIGNDYEIRLLEEKTGWSTEQMLEHVEFLILTLGENGSTIHTKEEVIQVAACPVLSVEDPTGAGDAYRAGFFTALSAGEPLRACGQAGSVAAAYAVEKYGTQNHAYMPKEFMARYEKTYGTKISLTL
ncbi:MAG: carbohydrate kinase family protein [Candidatus Magasanikbacteria bacterium CG10_big_fil_rev_8_21_14_0_10_47_10]|uniref:Carbohydrate kinase family protein n=1 Tax=Candidatus Magasanikbacteria bacterium CG10_big_fil_rev_8_21_14_0_10_47_10 TaxID=1974652 RepID=A0A2H0TQU6_9BACT|nr:MAG: carbohydrate kinase family protein [Candidatus Magasanikbacteria bacterium CG10_big_fil_rev_8_21_14_0_10_47_10]